MKLPSGPGLIIASAVAVLLTAACGGTATSLPMAGSDNVVARRTAKSLPSPVTVQVFFLNEVNFVLGTPPFVTPVEREVTADDPVRASLDALFAGPTADEEAEGLRFVASGSTGIADLEIADGVARVRLVGGCFTNGSVFSIAQEIIPTLRQFPGVDHVKIYGPDGDTEEPDGPTNSIPGCLEP